MHIRSANIRDVESIIDLLKRCSMFYEPIDTKASIEEKIKHDKESLIVAIENEKIIGCVFVIFDPWQSFIYHLAVDKDHRGSGVGNSLMEKAENIVKGRKCKLANIFIEENNDKVVDFYKKRDWYLLYKCINMEKRL